MQQQQPVVIPPDHEPEPDGAVICGRLGDTLEKAGPSDILAIIEVADSSLYYDLNVKLGLYADAKIPQYIVVDLINNVLLVHEKPKSDSYQSVQTFARGSSVRINAGAGNSVEVPVGDLIPKIQ